MPPNGILENGEFCVTCVDHNQNNKTKTLGQCLAHSNRSRNQSLLPILSKSLFLACSVIYFQNVFSFVIFQNPETTARVDHQGKRDACHFTGLELSFHGGAAPDRVELSCQMKTPVPLRPPTRGSLGGASRFYISVFSSETWGC